MAKVNNIKDSIKNRRDLSFDSSELSDNKIPQLGEEYLDLLESVGINTLESLLKQKPNNLYSILNESNNQKKIVTRLPSEKTLDFWIKTAFEIYSNKFMEKWYAIIPHVGLSRISLVSSVRSIEDTIVTPAYLSDVIAPYLASISGVQKVIDELRGHPQTIISIKSFSKFSPISISLDGAAEAIQKITEIIVPWRRNHAKLVSSLTIEDKQTDIAKKKADTLETLARVEKVKAETENIRQDTEIKKIQRDEARLDLEKQILIICNDLIDAYAPDLPAFDRIKFIIQFSPSIENLLTSELEVNT